jgi:hypothetical protein
LRARASALDPLLIHERRKVDARVTMQDIYAVYIGPSGDDRQFETRFQDVVRRVGCVRVVHRSASASELARLTSDTVFLSASLPNLVVVRGGEVVAQAIGDLPTREIEAVLRTAIEHAGLPLASAA